ncbi:Leucine-rich repeat-containing protein 43 [Desmophyllum pertusum]|uniref:Leucine-rich repeat-containing protein 43 n=1 Tax=Desmophyllum pertusum TaxID=174260 RepID=A0A9X0CF53_9CNID|nr:Leucine-rich repeat-containing protein 43 [Desmophyllum pertusum]
MTETVASFNVTAAFHSQLNTLCIREFPCGYGSWRAQNLSSNVSLKSTRPISAVLPTIIPENSAQLETVENLQELAVKTPYDVDSTWSSEAESLREIAVKTPDKLTEAFILKFFKSLRIVDKKVTEIDDGLLRLKNLKQLTLSANLIKNIDSKRLPKGLEELELAANQISDISPLCVCPPPLIHLGLSYNLISSITGHMKSISWPHLLSLDLSFNNLADLYNTINVLKTLPKLKNLVLQGNPLALVPGYRGYTIDSIRQLTILDDIRISADEKHFFKGLSKLKDVPVDEAQVMITIKTIKGVKMPEEIEDPEINSDYPKTEHKYHVEFQYLKSALRTILCESPALSIPTISIMADDSHSETQEDGSTVYNDENQPSEDSGVFQTVATGSLPWNEEGIELDYSKKFHTSLLVPLRDFIQDGIYFTVVKTKHLYVVEDPNAPQNLETKPPASAKSRPGSKMQKSPTKEKRKDSGKGKGKDGKGKKNKQEDIELFELPRTRSILGSCQVSLASLLEGELEVETECVCEGGEETGDSEKKDGGSGAKSDSSDKKKPKDPTDKPSKGNLRAATPGKGKAGRGKSSKDDKKTKEKDKHEESMEDEEDGAPLPPLTIQVHIKLHYWKSAREAAQEFPPQGVPSLTEHN